MIDKNGLVVVTGAAGFVATHIVEQLLAKGYRVRGTVRNPAGESAAHLRQLRGASERLQLVPAELLDANAWPKVLEGASVVMHTASPYSLDVKDPQRDLVDPALQGTRNVLNAAASTRSVKRVVLTSSMASITDEPESEKVLTEDDWNELSSLTRNPYYYSKTVAEREAWKLAEQHKDRYSLVAINPFLVIGPSHSQALNTSNQLFSDLLNGTYPGIMRLVWGFVDVRDVARAHVEAMERDHASGRYICAAGTMPMREVVALLREAGYEGYSLPKLGLDCAVGDYAVRLSSYFQPKGVGTYLRTHVGRTPQFDNGKIQRELGLTFRPLADTIRDTVLDVIRHGHVKQAPTVQAVT
ncbi:MAG: aldehyde reductase [Myxococcales bacterium]